MQPRLRAFWSILVLAPAAAGGCNLIFGIQGGQGSGGGGSASTTSSSTTSASTSSSSTTSSSTTSSSTTSTSSSSTGSSGSSSGSVAFAVTPGAVTLLAQSTFAFSTTGAPGPVTWSLADSSAGAVTAQGIYTASLKTGTFVLTATSGAAKATASITVQQTVVPTVIVPAGELATATGHGSQTHLAYAQNTGEWWLFHDVGTGAAGALATAFSKDFATWTPGEQLTLPMGHSGDGRDLSVASRTFGAHDVVHISQGYGDPSNGATLGRYHIRASLTAGHAAFGLARIINSGSGGPPDGTSTVIMPSGLVIDTTGYVPTGSLNPPGSIPNCGGGDVDVYTSDVMENGTTSFDTVQFGPQVLWCVPNVVNARQLVSLLDTAILLYPDEGSIPTAVGGPNLLMNTSQNIGNWSPVEPASGSDVVPPRVFPDSPAKPFGVDDWAATVQSGALHAVRRLTDDTFEHRVMSSVPTWGPGGSIPMQTTLQGSGLFLAPYGDGLVLVALGPNNGSQILYTAYSASSGLWSSWQTLTLDAAVRGYIAGFAPEGGVKPAVIWTQTAGASYAVGGVELP